MRKLVHLFLILLFAGATSGSAQEEENRQPAAPPVRQVFLIQNSGWMEPFYQDASSPLRPFANRLVAQARRAGGEVAVAAFNQDGQVPGRTSPEVLFQGGYDEAAVRGAIDRIDLPRKPSGAYADADLRGALAGTIARILHREPGIIWLVTNNKDAPDNNQEVHRNTSAFYDALRNSPAITAVAAFPMRRFVQGEHYVERGLIIYAIAYGERARAQLDRMLADGAPVRGLFPAPPVRLKPLREDPVELLLESRTEGVSARVDGNRLFIRDAPPGGAVIQLRGRLRNRYYPQVIRGARLSARWTSGNRELAGAVIRMSPAQVTNIPANAVSAPINMELRLPPVSRPGLFADAYVLRGELEVRLDNIQFGLDPAFVARVSAFTAGDRIQADQERTMENSLPEVFMDYRRVTSASMKVPVTIRGNFSGWPLLLMIGGGALLLALLGALLFLMSRARRHLVRVGSSDMPIMIKPRERRTLSNPLGERAEVTGSLFGRPSVRQLDPGAA